MDNLVPAMGKWVSILYRYRLAYLNRELKKFNIGSGQSLFLYPLYHHNGISQESLANLLNIDKGTTARAIKKLEEAGYVIRKQDEEDKRSYKLFISEKALDIKDKLFEISYRWSDIVTTGFTDAQKIMVQDLLEKMSENACILLKNNRNSK